ncbi:MAG: hypothetical protein MK106_05860 [Mariniblastus sp.]|nr:hypothetical protein [Mariniblastus sp.]
MSELNLEILAYEETPLGLLFLRRRELLSQPGTVVTEVTLNHEFLMSSLYTDSERVLAEHALGMHGGRELSVLVGGLGLGYTAYEALKSDRVSHLEVIEFLPQVIHWTRDGLIPLSAELNQESRLKLTCGDVYQRMQAPPSEKFDLILIDVDHSPEERLADQNISFYSTSGLQAAQSHLQSDGVLGVWSYAKDSPFAESLRDVFNEVTVVPVTHQNELINETRTDWLFFARN